MLLESLAMELPQLRAILALRELSSFARAGEHLHLSPPAVFGQIRQLEEELGEKLYERMGKRLQLTATGELLAEYAKTIVQQHDDAVRSLKGQGGEKRSLIRLGSGPHTSIRILPYLLRAFREQSPHAEIRQVTGDDLGLIRDVHAGVIDAVLMTLPAEDAELERLALWKYKMVFVLPPSRRRASLPELRDLPFLVFHRPIVIDAAVRQHCDDAGFTPSILLESDQPDAIKELVKLGVGATILPLWSVAREAQAGELRVIHPKRRHFYSFGWLYRRTSCRGRALTALLGVSRRWPEWWPMADYVATE